MFYTLPLALVLAAPPAAAVTVRDDSQVRAVAFTPDGRTVVSGGQSVSGPSHGHLRFRDAATGKETAAVPFPHGVEGVAVSPDGKAVAVSTGGVLQGPANRPFRVEAGVLQVLPVGGGKPLLAPKTGAHTCPSVAFSPDGATLAAGGNNADDRGARVTGGAIRLWDAATGKETKVLKGHEGIVESIAFAPDGKTLAAASRTVRGRPGQPGTGQVKVWDLTTGKEKFDLKGHAGPVWCVAVSPDGATVASGGADGTVRLWHAATGKEAGIIKTGLPVVVAVAFAPDGKAVAAGGGDPGTDGTPGGLALWDVAKRTEVAALIGHEVTVTAVAFTRDGKRLASGDQRGTLKVWNLDGR